MRRRSSSVAVFLRTDTAFIVRFLRARKFDPSAAFRLYARYFEYRAHHGALFRAFRATEPRLKAALLDGFPCVIGPPGGVGGAAGGDGDGTTTTIIVLFASNWDQKVRTRTPGALFWQRRTCDTYESQTRKQNSSTKGNFHLVYRNRVECNKS